MQQLQIRHSNRFNFEVMSDFQGKEIDTSNVQTNLITRLHNYLFITSDHLVYGDGLYFGKQVALTSI
jgi:hypothetical protein